jgi:tetratricopeptide (TPR) repeat protein
MDQTPSNAEVIQKLTRIVESLRAQNDTTRLHLALAGLGKEFMRSGAVLKALSCFDEAVPLAQQLGDLESEALHTGNQGSALVQIGNFDMALRALRRAQSLGRRTNQPAVIYDALVAMASLEINRENPDQAVDYLREAMEVAQDSGDANRELNAAIGLAQAHWETQALEDAIAQYRAALDLSMQLGRLDAEMECCDRLSALYHLTEDFSEESAILQQAIQRIELSAGDGMPPAWLLRLGESYLQLGQWDSAEKAFLRALPLGIEQANLAAITRALGGLSVGCAEQGRLAESYEYAQKAVRSAEQSDQPDLYAEQLILLAFAERDRGCHDQAVAAASRALEVFVQTENFAAEQRVRRLLDDLAG